jgi:hypothetical protein
MIHMPTGVYDHKPTKYTKEMHHKFCVEIANGGTYRSICKELGIYTTTVNDAMIREPDWFETYIRARRMQATIDLDDCIEIADGPYDKLHDVKDKEVRIKARQYRLERYNPAWSSVHTVIDQSKHVHDNRRLTVKIGASQRQSDLADAVRIAAQRLANQQPAIQAKLIDNSLKPQTNAS